jgi:hypothetical protein
MNDSTDGVTLYAGFISDVLSYYEDQQIVFKELFRMVEDLDLSDPQRPVPMAVYNDICEWVEKNIGPSNVQRAGEAIGDRAYSQMVSLEVITPESGPQDGLRALKQAADTMIQDPLGRGWNILEMTDTYAVMQRTQTFNRSLQLGLLESLVKKAGKAFVKVSYEKSVTEGDEFDEYRIEWS